MRASQAQLAYFQAWLTTSQLDPACCHFCEATGWGNWAVEVLPLTVRVSPDGGRQLWFVRRTCRSCHNIELFDAPWVDMINPADSA